MGSLLVIRKSVGLLALSALCATTIANPCINAVDLGADYDWGSEPQSFPLLNFRASYDDATGQTFVVGMVHNGGADAMKMWSWDGFGWTERDLSGFFAQYSGPAITSIRGFALDPITRFAVVIVRAGSGLDFAYAFHVDNPHLPMVSLGNANDSTSMARARFVVYAHDEGAFYFFSSAGGVQSFNLGTGVAESHGTQAVPFPLNSDTQCVYDEDDRRVVFFTDNGGPARTHTYTLDDNALHETTDAATAPPTQTLIRYRLVASPASGEVFAMATRAHASAPLSTDALYRLEGDGDWAMAATFDLSTNGYFQAPPAAAFDITMGRIVMFGGFYADSTSNHRTLAIEFDEPAFAASPTEVRVDEGRPCSLVALPTAHSFYSTVVWRKDGEVVAETAIPALFIPNATAADHGVYTAELSGICGAAVSQEITLTVTCGSDTNGDGTINFTDLNAVLSNFGQDCD